MKLLNKKICTVILAVFALVCFTLFATTAFRANAAVGQAEIPVYRVTVQKQLLADARSMTNRIPISKDAQKVTFEYTPIVSTGTGNYNALMAFSGENQNTGATVASSFGTGYGVPNGTNWVDQLAKVGRVYTIEFDMVNLTATWYSTLADGTGKTIIRENAKLSNPDLTVNYVGFAYGSTNIDQDGDGKLSDAELDLAWYAELDVRCFDDKGRDLQVCSMQGSIWVDGITEKPLGNATLASFDKEDYMLDNNSGGVGEMAHSTSVLSVVDAKTTGGIGASGGVLEIKKPPQPATFSIQMGRVLTAEDIAKGGSVVIRVWSQHNSAYLYGCSMYPFLMDKSGRFNPSALSKEYFQEIMNIGNQSNFMDLEIPNEDLLLFCDEDGSFRGLSFWMGAWEGATYTVYIDEIYYKLPVTVNLYDQNGGSLGSKTVNSGASLSEQFSVIIPDVAGKEFIGWTKTLGGTDYYNVEEIGYADATLNLYASYGAPVTNKNSYIGVYANAESGKFFQLAADGEIIDATDAIDYSTYKLTQDAVIFDGETAGVLDGYTITINGVDFVKQEQAYSVVYKILGEEYESIIVPAGYKAIDFEYETEDFVFGGWKNGETIFDFDSGVSENIVLEADLTINEIALEEYVIYENAYYSSETNIIYIVKAPDADGARKLVKVESGVATDVGEYQITKSNKLLIGQKLYEFRPMKTVSSSTGEKYVGPLEIVVDGVDYWIFNKTFTVTVHYDASRMETFEIDASDNFLFNAPETPSKTGYTFKGWRLGNGQKYEFDKAVTSELEIYAIMQYENAKTASAKDDGCGSSISGGNVAVIAVVLVLVSVVIIKQRKMSKNGKAN